MSRTIRTKRQTKPTRVYESRLHTISQVELRQLHRQMMQQVPAINTVRQMIGKPPLIVPED
ncbi:MAG: hypothetical protein GY938_27055 [Ketobacter sp.]|nr:hypothetical protein [Ketobacter sp.]